MRITVVIPCFNAENVLSRCVESVIRDGAPDKEILIVNDGSTDRTAEIAQMEARRNPNLVRVITTQKKGANHARNVGLRAATGSLVQFLDSDDELVDDKLMNAVSSFSNNDGLVCVYSDGMLRLERGPPSF